MNTVQMRTASGKVSPVMPVTTSIGRKVWMAVSGLVMLGYVIGHMLGNLQIFIGQNQLNNYAEKLHELLPLLWGVRIVLLVLVIIHIYFGITLWWRNRQSRPVTYQMRHYRKATLASRTMIWTGLGILLYVVYHLLQFTLVVTNPRYASLVDSMGRHDVYSMVVIAFQNPLISSVYILAMIFLAFHLSHAVSSFFQTLGWNTTRVEPVLKRIAYTLAIVLFIGFTSIPVSVLLGIVKLPGGGY